MSSLYGAEMILAQQKRRLVQIISAVVANGYLPGFWLGKVYEGKTKQLCVPFLNCYSCPGALASCPVGVLQQLAAGQKISLFVIGFIVAVGALGGRLVCGWLCPFGLIQDLLSRITRWKSGLYRRLGYVKYVVMVLIVPMSWLWIDQYGLGAPYFCQYVCPAGTLQAALPLLVVNSQLHHLIGTLFYGKLALLIFFLISAVVVVRPFCRIVCPLGAAYGIANRWSAMQMRFDEGSCRECDSCVDACLLNIDVRRTLASGECIRCLRCVKSCPEGALTFGLSSYCSSKRGCSRA